MKATENPHLEQDKHPLSKFVWSSEITMLLIMLLTAGNCLFNPLSKWVKL